jgi:exodeoxyribonuclease V alpha subunit
MSTPLDFWRCRRTAYPRCIAPRDDLQADAYVQLVLAYATTIHKSQGSEYPAVVIPLSVQHYPMLQRNLVYIGVTRGKRLVVLVGQRKALTIAVKGARTRKRWSKLREWLAAVHDLRS